jgi:hypothetical protein
MSIHFLVWYFISGQLGYLALFLAVLLNILFMLIIGVGKVGLVVITTDEKQIVTRRGIPYRFKGR